MSRWRQQKVKENKRRLDGQQITASGRRGGGAGLQASVSVGGRPPGAFSWKVESALIASIKARPAKSEGKRRAALSSVAS